MSDRNPRENAAVRLAAKILTDHFTDKSNQPIRSPFYITQLEVLYERDFFPWVTADAIGVLTEDGIVTKFRKTDLPESEKLRNLSDIVFVANRAAYSENPTLVRRHAQTIAELVNSYSHPTVTKAVGDQLEGLVKYEIRANQFKIDGVHTNKFKGKTWTETGHDLDIIAQHASGDLNIGVEVKNTFDLMDADEIDTKIDICHFLGLVPVFAVRWMKPYIDCIRNQGGFSWIFKTLIYPPGFEDFTKSLFEKLSFPTRTDSNGNPLQFPVNVRTELPQKSAKKFSDWVSNSLTNPPQRNPDARCRGLRRAEHDEAEDAEVYMG